MGTLKLPSSGIVYIDTAPVIYSVEKHADYWPLLRPLWEASKTGRIEVVTSELTLLETLVGPSKQGDSALIMSYENLLTSTEIRLLQITTDVLRSAARLRAETNIKTPDAIHAASALAAGSAQFVTNDTQLKRVDGLPIVLLSEIV